MDPSRAVCRDDLAWLTSVVLVGSSFRFKHWRFTKDFIGILAVEA